MQLAETRYLSNLVKGVRATMLVSDLEPKVQRAIVNKATAVKLFAEAGFRRTAVPVLEEIVAAYGDDPRKEMIDALVGDVLKHWNFQNLIPEGGR